MTLPRSRLLARLVASEPRLIQLCAPAGYGKSSLARVYARRFERHCICDCANVRSAAEFMSRAMSALAGEPPGESASLAMTRLRVHASKADEAAWSRSLLETWKSRLEPSLFILERAHEIASQDGVLALLGDMLAARPAERVMLITTHAPLPMRFRHYLEPRQMLAFTRAELRFDADEAVAIFDGTEIAPALIERIVALADGWPIALLLLALFAKYDAGLEQLIDRLEGSPRARLHEQLAGEVLSAFTPEMMATLLATAAIPNASLDDISAATGIRHATPIIDRLLHLPGFVSSEGGAYQAHPLVLRALRPEHDAAIRRYRVCAADEFARFGDALRAAELYALCGDAEAAAEALDALPATLFAQPTSRLVDALANVDADALCARPNLWMALLSSRTENVEDSRLYEEGSKLLSRGTGSSPATRRRLHVRLAMLAQRLERLAKARAHLEQARGLSRVDEAPEEERLLLITSALVAAKQGRFADADRFADECDAVQGARRLRFDAERATIELERARFLGDWEAARKLSEESLYAAQRSGTLSRVIEAARSVAREAWYCNDDARVAAANEILEDCGDGAGAVAVHLSRWHAALVTTNLQQAKDFFDRAIEGIDAAENDFLRIMLRVSAALLLPSQRRRLLEARALAARVESSPLQASLELLVDSPELADYGIFKYLAARVARSPLRVDQNRLYLRILRSQVRRGGELVHVSDRGFELLAALALLPAGSSKEALAAAIWPELDGDAALNALKMCVSRTRAQLLDKEAIQSTKRGYVLSDHVAVDARELEALLSRARATDGLSDSLRHEIQEALRSLESRERMHAADWAWFAPHAARLDELQRAFTFALASSYPAGVSVAGSGGSSRSYRRAL